VYTRGQPSPHKYDHQHNAKDNVTNFTVSAGGAGKWQIELLKEIRAFWHDTRSRVQLASSKQTTVSNSGFPVPYAKKQSSHD